MARRLTWVLQGVVLAWAVSPTAVQAFNERSLCIYHLRTLALALAAYHEYYGSFPTDICDPQGKPLLSWRVRLLPFVEGDFLYKQFRLDEPWDRDTNRPLVAEIPKVYRCWSADLAHGQTCYLLPRGNSTILPSGANPDWRVNADDASRTIVLLEVNADHAVFWTKPEDLAYEPSKPLQGLGTHHHGDFLWGKGAFALFANGDVRFVSADVDPDLINALIGIQGDKRAAMEWPWYRALCQSPSGRFLGPSLLILGLLAMGGSWVLLRLWRGKAVSPGEILWLLAGMEALVYLILVAVWYCYEPLPLLYRKEHQEKFWFLPSCAGSLVSGMAFVWYRAAPIWRGWIGVAAILSLLVTLDALTPHQHQAVEESFLTAVSPIFLAIISAAAMLLTLLGDSDPTWKDRRPAHWLGLATCLLPLTWFAFWCAAGQLAPRELFVRIRD